MNKQVNKLLLTGFVSLGLGLIFWFCVDTMPKDAPGVIYWSALWLAILSCLTCILCFILSIFAARKPAGPNDNRPVPPSENRAWLGRYLMIVTSVVVSAGLFVLGYLLIPAGHETVCRVVTLAVMVGLTGLFIIAALRKKAFIKRLNDMSVREQQTYMLSHREKAEETAASKLALLKRKIIMSDALAVLIGLASAAGAAAFGGAGDGWTWCAVPYILFASMLLLALSRIRFPLPREDFSEDVTHVTEADFPLLYENARRAMRAVGAEHELHISILPDFSANIALIGGVCSLNVGAQMLGLLSEEEMFTILLHEFSHVTDENRDRLRVNNYGIRLMNNANNVTTLVGSVNRLFGYRDTVYLWELNMFRYADTLSSESAADAAMARHGDARTAASALLKFKYHDLFEWEELSCDYTPDYAQPTCERPFMQIRLQQYEASLAAREPLWHDLFGKEILSRSASHPTIRMRTEALGVPDPVLLPKDWSEAYAAEMDKAFSHADKLLVDSIRDNYEERRKEVYLDRLERVEKWEAEGCPLAPETYADLIVDLGSLGRVDDSLALCDRVIAAWPGTGSDSAAYQKGVTLLHRFDPAGVDCVYSALETNSNFIEDGLDVLGSFFCLTGRQEELDSYRERAVAKAEEMREKFGKIGELLPTDTLEPEHLPGDQLERLQAFLGGVADGHIRDVFLVHKPITDDFSTSPVIVRFRSGTTDEDKWEIMHKIFRYLDSGPDDWQYSLFDYDEIPKMQARVERVPDSVIWTHPD